jgi:5-methylcytosine-specific restriction endonuclease McrA
MPGSPRPTDEPPPSRVVRLPGVRQAAGLARHRPRTSAPPFVLQVRAMRRTPIKPRACDECGRMFTPRTTLGARFCSPSCSTRRQHAASRPMRERNCKHCGKLFMVDTVQLVRRYCGPACYYTARSARPAFLWLTCGVCGNQYRRTRAAVARVKTTPVCSRACNALRSTGANHHGFRGGTRQRRGPGWTVNRDACRIRDRECRSCGKTPEENQQALSIDHLIPWRMFADELVANSLDNLVALCRSCHARKTSRAEAAYFRGDVLAWRAFLRDVEVDYETLIQFGPYLLHVEGEAA